MNEMCDCSFPDTEFEFMHEVRYEHRKEIEAKFAEFLRKRILHNESVSHVVYIHHRGNTYTCWDKGLGSDYTLNRLAEDATAILENCLAYIFDCPSTSFIIYTGHLAAYPLISLCA
jgi:hypothetical protein